jgi:hypothetical protein
MTVQDEILKELQWQTKLLKAELALLSEIKFEILNANLQKQTTYTIPIPEKKGIIQTFWKWLKQ